jgi:hypothetical protein
MQLAGNILSMVQIEDYEMWRESLPQTELGGPDVVVDRSGAVDRRYFEDNM